MPRVNPILNPYKTEKFRLLILEHLEGGLTYQSAKVLAGYLGAHVLDSSSARFCIWYPGIKNSDSIFLELFLPISELIYDKPDQHCNMKYYRLPVLQAGDFFIAVIDEIVAGNENSFGSFYRFLTVDSNGTQKIILDPMAWSLPYGILAPAEVYDIKSILRNRKDQIYYLNLEKQFRNKGDNRIPPSDNLLEIHTGTSTQEGSLQELALRFKQASVSLAKGLPLTQAQKNFSGFNGIELMPIEPVIQHPVHHLFWSHVQEPKENNSELTIRLRKPDITNWGYDTAIFGSAAINPSILTTGRPHELLNLIEILHNFSVHPIKVILDVVFGHADRQAEMVLPPDFFTGENSYGLSINFKHPLVRAMILEILKRKLIWGIDGFRIDASHDITTYDAMADSTRIDDDFLKEISSIEAEAAGVTFKPWMIFEDARPWPRDDWELACTYRDVTEHQKHPHQWGPMIFAYNSPYIYTYWLSKWWRLSEHCVHGNKWITGYANHDTLRRGTESDPSKVSVNFSLGNSLKMVMESAYNNPSSTLLINGFLPGVPMDFLHAITGTPWTFFRNTDTQYAVKVAASEAHFTEWQITSIEYRKSRFFKKLKSFGFGSLSGLRRFAITLRNLLITTDYNLSVTATLLNHYDPGFDVSNWSIEKLNEYASCWMEDMHEYCNTDNHKDSADPRKTTFNYRLRQFRLQNPWLNHNFGPNDFLRYREPVEGSVICYGYRKNDETGKEVFILANLEGQARMVTPAKFDIPFKTTGQWGVAVSTPSVRAKKIDQPLRLSISQGIIFETNDS